MILKKTEDGLVFTAGKYAGKSLKEVSKTDKTYATWTFEKAALDLSDEVFYELQQFLMDNRIKPFDL